MVMPGRPSWGQRGGERIPTQPGGHRSAMAVDLPGGCVPMRPDPRTLRLWLGDDWVLPQEASTTRRGSRIERTHWVAPCRAGIRIPTQQGRVISMESLGLREHNV